MAGSENWEGWLVCLQNADTNWNLSIQLEVCLCIVGMWTVCVRLCEVQFQRKHLFLKSNLFVWKIELAAAEFADKKFTLFKDCISKLPCLLSPPLWLAWSSPLLARHGPQVCSICLNDPYWRAWNDFEQLKIFSSDAWTTQEQTRYKYKHQTVLQSPRKPRAFQEDDHAMWVAKVHPKQFSTFCNLFSFWIKMEGAFLKTSSDFLQLTTTIPRHGSWLLQFVIFTKCIVESIFINCYYDNYRLWKTSLFAAILAHLISGLQISFLNLCWVNWKRIWKRAILLRKVKSCGWQKNLKLKKKKMLGKWAHQEQASIRNMILIHLKMTLTMMHLRDQRSSGDLMTKCCTV